MKRRFSLNALMHNRNAMLIFSLIAAVLLWGTVVYGSSENEDRVLRIQVPVNLEGTYAQEQLGLCLIGEDTFEVEVHVKGPFSVISQLSSEDVRVRVDTSSIYGAGRHTLSLIASRGSAENDYTISGCFPNTVTVTCDHWDTNLIYKVGVDLNGVKVADDQKHRLGDAVLDSAVLPDGNVRIEGPRTITSKIVSVVARITEPTAIDTTQVFGATLVALDEQGNEVDMSGCKFTDLDSNAVNVIVPVWVSRTVNFKCELVNVPSGLSKIENLVTLSPPSIVVVGPQADVDAFAQSVENLVTLDFDHLSEEELTQKIPLNVPSSVRVLDNTNEVTLSLNVSDYTAKSFTMNIGSLENNVHISGLSAERLANVPTQTVTFTVIGKTRRLNSLSEDDFVGEISLSGATQAGMDRYQLRIRNNKYDDMWVYYGEDTSGISVYMTIM